ncbi:MAG: winged helix-turn-helix domain-containing protein [Hyphomicrobiaceae bacterium]|nr:winged helix-turn-helix domain-containing protein [Hyphomicrobiaceae bacterium]
MTRVVLRIDFDDKRYIGHGRIELLEHIAELGSIAKAAKAMNMSYKRAWYLADSINDTFAEPVIERQHGGRGGGSAYLTKFGQILVRDYRGMETRALKLFAKPLKHLEMRLAPTKRAHR